MSMGNSTEKTADSMLRNDRESVRGPLSGSSATLPQATFDPPLPYQAPPPFNIRDAWATPCANHLPRNLRRKERTMTLWTPYVEEMALDLTKAAIKEEDYAKLHRHCRYSPENVRYPAYIPYPQPIYAPMSEISPNSGGSISSYDSCTRLHDQARYQSRLTNLDFSPPVSPTLDRPLKRTYDMIDVDYLSDDPNFQAFKRDALRVMAEKNGGSLLADNPRMRRAVQSRIEAEDEAYRKQRERNNHAAKQSRNKRKLREIHLALKVSYLRREVANLRAILSTRSCGICHRSCRD